MKQKIAVNLIPTYKTDTIDLYTRFNPKDSTIGDLVIYDQMLHELNKNFEIERISVLGGEISLLSDLYFDLLYSLLKLHTNNIIVHTNFKHFNKALINGTDIITVDYNFTDVPEVFKNIKAAIQIGKIINIQTLDVACQKETPRTSVTVLNGLNIKSWEIVPYIKTVYSKIMTPDYGHFEKIVLSYLKISNNMNFAFHNKLQLEGIISNNNYEIGTVYLTPYNKFALEDYTNDNFVLTEFEDFEQFLQHYNQTQIKQAQQCKDCKVKLKCLANYYRYPSSSKESCCGFSNLIYTYSKHKEQQ